MESKKIRNTSGLVLSFFMFFFGVFGIVKSVEIGDNIKLLKCLFGTLVFLSFIIIGFIKRYKSAHN